VIDKGKKEIAVHTLLYVPFMGSGTIGLGKGWEVRLGMGQVGQIFDEAPILGGDVSLTKSHIKRKWLYTSARFGIDYFTSPSMVKQVDKFNGIGVFTSYSLGLFPAYWLGLFSPLRVTYLYAKWEDDPSTGFAVIPGFGMSLEGKHFFARGSFNQPVAIDYPLTPKVGDIFLFYYLGLQVGYRW